MGRVFVGNTEFKSKKKLYEFCRDLYGAYKQKAGTGLIAISAAHREFTLELLKRHPNSTEKLRKPILNICIGKNFSGGTHMVLIYQDSSKDNVSWVDCCKGLQWSFKAELLYALRRAVSQQVIVKKAGRCEQCSSTEKLEVDHVTPFKKITDVFLGSCDYVSYSDADFLSKWAKFHKETAKLQTLCYECHSKKTKFEAKMRLAQRQNGTEWVT